MNEPSVREAVRRDGKYLAPRLREADKNEISLLLGISPREALTRPFDRNKSLRKIYSIVGEDRTVIAMFGISLTTISTDLGKIGSPWFLCSPELLDSNWRSFVREAPHWIAALGQDTGVYRYHLRPGRSNSQYVAPCLQGQGD